MIISGSKNFNYLLSEMVDRLSARSSVVFTSNSDALKHLRDHPCDIIFLYANSKPLKISVIAKQLRSLHKGENSQAPIILICEDAVDPEFYKLMDDGYIQIIMKKPFYFNDLNDSARDSAKRKVCLLFL